jgi:purine-binding chemotaxis protein CheW
MKMTVRDQYIEVGIDKEKYALGIHDIHEIIKIQPITEIPSSRSCIKGVISLRGKIVTIISLRNRFGLMEETYTKLTRIVVVNFKKDRVGIIVDRVNQVISFSSIQGPPDSMGELQSACFTGIGHTEEGLVFILKLDNVLQEG